MIDIDKIVGWAIRIMVSVYITCVVIFLFSGCTTVPKPPTEILTVVPVSCVEATPVRPPLKTDDQLKAMDDYNLTLTLLAEHYWRQIYESKLEAVMEGCRF